MITLNHNYQGQTGYYSLYEGTTLLGNGLYDRDQTPFKFYGVDHSFNNKSPEFLESQGHMTITDDGYSVQETASLCEALGYILINKLKFGTYEVKKK